MKEAEKFTSTQKANAVLWFGICGDSEVVRNKFKTVYGATNENTSVPSSEEIDKWYKNFKNTGFTDIPDAVLHDEVVEKLGQHSKEIISTVGDKLSTWLLNGPRIRTFHPYHMEVLTFDPKDLEERKKFAKDQLAHIHKWFPILKSMWFAGEAKFYIDGRVVCNNLIYSKNRRSEDEDNLPHKIVRKYIPSDKPYVTVWAAINSESYIGPYFFPSGEIPSGTYKHILEKFVSQLSPMTSTIEVPIFIHDNSKIHTTGDVTTYLEKQFPHHWIGSGSTYANWPHHAPDLSPINFFLWGYIKSRVYKTHFEDLDKLKENIQMAFKNVTSDLLEESVEEYKTRLERVTHTNGNLVDASIYGEEVDVNRLNSIEKYAWSLHSNV